MLEERHLMGGVHVTTRRDRFGRETFKSVGARNVEQFHRRYTWDMGNRLLVTNTVFGEQICIVERNITIWV